jgi:hypothetical protein
MASPSFIDTWASASVRDLMVSASSPERASRRLRIALSTLSRSDDAILSPASLSVFSEVWISASAWFFASTTSRRF